MACRSRDAAGQSRRRNGCELLFQGEAGNLDRAVEIFSGVLDADPRHALAHFALALRLNPSLAETHHLLGRARLTAGDFRMAATMLERAATLRSDDYHALVLAAKARRSLKDEAGCRANLVRARRRIDEALQVTPDQRRLLCDQVSCMVELGATAQGSRSPSC